MKSQYGRLLVVGLLIGIFGLGLFVDSASADAQQDFQRGMEYGRIQDYKEAAKWLRKAAEQGHAEAQYLLGSLYEEGEGVPRAIEGLSDAGEGRGEGEGRARGEEEEV